MHRINKLMFSSRTWAAVFLSQYIFRQHQLTSLSVLPSTDQHCSPRFHQMPALKDLSKKPESLNVHTFNSSHYFLKKKKTQFFLFCLLQTSCKYQPNHWPITDPNIIFKCSGPMNCMISLRFSQYVHWTCFPNTYTSWSAFMTGCYGGISSSVYSCMMSMQCLTIAGALTGSWWSGNSWFMGWMLPL